MLMAIINPARLGLKAISLDEINKRGETKIFTRVAEWFPHFRACVFSTRENRVHYGRKSNGLAR